MSFVNSNRTISQYFLSFDCIINSRLLLSFRVSIGYPSFISKKSPGSVPTISYSYNSESSLKSFFLFARFLFMSNLGFAITINPYLSSSLLRSFSLQKYLMAFSRISWGNIIKERISMAIEE